MMASINQLEKLHKNIFNNLSFEELEIYFKNLSEERFKHINYISEEGVITNNVEKATELENISTDLCLGLPTLHDKYSALGIALVYDYKALIEKYNSEVKIAIDFYIKYVFSTAFYLNYIDITLESLLTIFEANPTEETFSTIKAVAEVSEKRFKDIDSILSSFLTNPSSVFEDVDYFKDIKKLFDSFYIKYHDLINKIDQLEKPEGSVNSG